MEKVVLSLLFVSWTRCFPGQIGSVQSIYLCSRAVVGKGLTCIQKSLAAV